MIVLLLTILMYLIDALAETSAKDDFISPLGVRGFVEGSVWNAEIGRT